MKAMKLSYKLEIDKLFERKLKRLEGSNTKEPLIQILLNTINIHNHENPVNICIDRVRVSNETVFCESMISLNQLNCNYPEEGNIVFFDSIKVTGNEDNLAAFLVAEAEKDDFEIDFGKLETTIVILSVKFTTKYAKAIQEKNPSDPKDLFIYTRYDEEEVDPNTVIFYTEKNFAGESYKYKKGEKINFNNNSHPLNDKFNSAKIGSNCTVTVWQHGGFSGAMKTFSKDVSDIDIGGLSGFSIT